MSQWESLFDQAVSIINQANSAFPVVNSWSFGGGTGMMLQIDHRESYDIGLFIDDPQILPYLNPSTQGYMLEMDPDEYKTDGVRSLKLAFSGVGEIDFICAPSLTEDPFTQREVRGVQVDLETPGEIIAKKIHYRGGSLQPRDIFDLACVAKFCGDEYVIEILSPLKDKVGIALGVAERMKPDFAKGIIEQLKIRRGYEGIPEIAHERTIALLKAAYEHEPNPSNTVSTNRKL